MAGRGWRNGGDPPDGHSYACPRCGQSVDRRDLAAVVFHENPEHWPAPGKSERKYLPPRDRVKGRHPI
jgi:hypothetical protein